VGWGQANANKGELDEETERTTGKEQESSDKSRTEKGMMPARYDREAVEEKAYGNPRRNRAMRIFNSGGSKNKNTGRISPCAE